MLQQKNDLYALNDISNQNRKFYSLRRGRSKFASQKKVQKRKKMALKVKTQSASNSILNPNKRPPQSKNLKKTISNAPSNNKNEILKKKSKNLKINKNAKNDQKNVKIGKNDVEKGKIFFDFLNQEKIQIKKIITPIPPEKFFFKQQDFGKTKFSHLAQLNAETALAAENYQRPKADYMTSIQHDLEPFMRSILVDWLLEIQQKFKMQLETAFLAVEFLDRFLSRCALDRNRLQLAGATAVLIAAKINEVSPPIIKNIVYICDGACNGNDVKEMESLMTKHLNWKFHRPTSLFFARLILQIAVEEKKRHFIKLAEMLLELSLLEYKMIQFKPSLLAVTAVFTAQKIFNAKVADLVHFKKANSIGTADLEKLADLVKAADSIGKADTVGRSKDGEVSARLWKNILKLTAVKKSEIKKCAEAMVEMIKKPNDFEKCVRKKYEGVLEIDTENN